MCIRDRYKITAFAMEDVEKYGVHKVTEMALSKIDPHNTNSLHVSFDIDSLDTLEAPSTGVPGKLYYIQYCIEILCTSVDSNNG